MLRLQEKMVAGTETNAKYIVRYHYQDAMKTLDLFKEVKNKNIQEHVAVLRDAW